MKKVFTVGQVAKICKVAPRTVSKWFDSGRLRGYRIPGSQDRRIPRYNFVRFLQEHGMPLAELEDEGQSKLLLIGLDATLVAILREHLPETDGFKIATAVNGFTAGMQADLLKPDCIVIDFQIGQNEAVQIYSGLRKLPEYQNTIVIALIGSEDYDEVHLLIRQGFNEVFRKPLDIALLAERIRRMIAERKTAA